jgi:uncharacterized Fe-S radical SAM superfamily protein PflX
MEEDILKFCKELIREQGNVFNVYCDLICDFCPFNDKANNRKCGDRPVKEIIQIAQNYIKEHEKTVNVINSIEEETITLDDLKDIKENNIVPTYYHKGDYDVIEFCNKYEIGFVTGNIIKYIVRYKNKNGIEDLKKVKEYLCRRYIENLIIDSEDKLKFYEENNLNYKQGIILDLVLDNCHKKAEEMLNSLIKYEEKKESDINE